MAWRRKKPPCHECDERRKKTYICEECGHAFCANCLTWDGICWTCAIRLDDEACAEAKVFLMGDKLTPMWEPDRDDEKEEYVPHQGWHGNLPGRVSPCTTFWGSGNKVVITEF